MRPNGARLGLLEQLRRVPVRVRAVAESDRYRVRNERDDPLCLGDREGLSKAAVNNEHDALVMLAARVRMKQGHSPTVHDDLVDTQRPDIPHFTQGSAPHARGLFRQTLLVTDCY